MKKLDAKSENKPLKGMSSIHVSLSSPRLLRREVLSLAIETIQLLKHHERLKSLKKTKIELTGRLKQEMDGIRKLVLELNTSDLPLSLEEVRKHPRFRVHEKEAELPDVEIIGEFPKKKYHKDKELEKERELVEEPKENEKLEEDLEALRKKLADL